MPTKVKTKTKRGMVSTVKTHGYEVRRRQGKLTKYLCVLTAAIMLTGGVSLFSLVPEAEAVQVKSVQRGSFSFDEEETTANITKIT